MAYTYSVKCDLDENECFAWYLFLCDHIMESDDFKKALVVALQFFPGIKLKRENRTCASKACLANEKTSSSGFCRFGLSDWLFHLLALSIGMVRTQSSLCWGSSLRSFSFISQMLLAFGVTSERSLASNRNWSTIGQAVEGVCGRERLKL